MALFVESNGSFNWQVGLETDIGGGRENQDDCFVWIKRDDNIIVLCVLDGHGREVGKIASESAKACLFKHLDENYRNLIESPSEFLVNAHGIAHEHIRNSFRSELKRQGFDVVTTDEGYLMKRKQATDGWSCVHGGTSCSIVALIDQELYIANVGDSTGILCSSFGVLSTADLRYVRDAAVPSEKWRVKHDSNEMVPGVPLESSASGGGNSDDGKTAQVPPSPNEAGPACSSSSGAGGASGGTGTDSISGVGSSSPTSTNRNASTLVVTAEHSPECPYEYERLLAFRSREGSPTVPALVVVYDSSSNDKTRCAPCFERDSSGKPCVTNRGRYVWLFLFCTHDSCALFIARLHLIAVITRMCERSGRHWCPRRPTRSFKTRWRSRAPSATCTCTLMVSHSRSLSIRSSCCKRSKLFPSSQLLPGVTHLPEVQKIDMTTAFRQLQGLRSAAATASESGQSSSPPPTATPAAVGSGLSAGEVASSTLCLVLATDGVWDNWAYEDVNKFVMDPSCLGAVGAAPDGAKRVTISFMQRNALYAKRNFGSNADNATGIVLYISQDPRMPSL